MSTRSKRTQEDDSDSETPMKSFKGSGDEDDRRASMLSPSSSSSNLAGLNGFRSRHGTDKPAELFRKDLISAMKLADSDTLQDEEFFIISDPWRQEWERGVQVPVNPDSIPFPRKCVVEANKHHYGVYGFKLPKKLLHAMNDDQYKHIIHDLHETHKQAEQVCRYDLDDQDVHWLIMVNEEREMCGDPTIEECQMEKVMEEMESQCHANMQAMIKTVEGLGIEYDENVVCDVCRSPDSEDSNEMVFCDQCDICVHQACYGIQTIPEGNWLCRICTLGIRPTCILCPKTGGAMKSTRSGSKWAHVSCSLWIPEVSIGSPEKMEPITKISHIPSSRWALICSQCRERTGACIQCSVKTCKTAFHVTCAFQHGLEMKTVLEEDDEEIQLKAYCGKHTKKRAEADGGTPRKDLLMNPSGMPKKESEMTEEEKTELRSHRLKKLAEEFYTCVKIPDVASATQMTEDKIEYIYNYWLLKRKSNFNKPLLTPKTEEEDLLSKQQEDCLIARMRMFVHLRQDLERVRNLCYMVTRREKMSRTLYRLKEDIFKQQVALLTPDHHKFETRDLTTIQTAHKATGTFYDDYDRVLRVAQEASGGVPLITAPIDHQLDSVRQRQFGRLKFGFPREFDSDSETNSVRGLERRHPNKRSVKHREILKSRLQQQKIDSHQEKDDKEQVDPCKVGGQEVIQRRHGDKWAASRTKIRDENRSLLNRRRLGNSSLARHKHVNKLDRKLAINTSRRSRLPGRLGRPKEEPPQSVSPSVDANGILPTSKLVIGKNIRDKVQSRLHRSLVINGVGQQSEDSTKPNEGSSKAEQGPSQNQVKDVSVENPEQEKEKVRLQSSRFKEGIFMTIDQKDAALAKTLAVRIEPLDGKGRESPSLAAKRESNSTPETRAKRKRIESDLESNGSDKLFDNIDGEISIKSSRDTTPDREAAGPVLRAKRKTVDLKRISVQRQIELKLKKHNPGGTGETDSEYADSEGSEHGAVARPKRRRRGSDTADTVSVDSTSSGSKYSTRSRQSNEHSLKVSATLNS